MERGSAVHIRVKELKRPETSHLLVEVTEGQNLIESFASSMAQEQEEVTLRFAGARFGTDAYIVIGVRKQGRGFDLLVPHEMWLHLVEEIHTFTVAVTEKNEAAIKLTLDWDEEAFQDFLDQCQQRFEDDPNLEVMGKIVHFFS